jgi:hypothetical protein
MTTTPVKYEQLMNQRFQQKISADFESTHEADRMRRKIGRRTWILPASECDDACEKLSLPLSVFLIHHGQEF